MVIQLARGLATAAQESGSSSFDWVSIVTTWGPAGVVLALVMLELLVPKWAYDSVKLDRDYWRKSSEDKDAALEAMRNNVEAANKRADSSQEAASTTLRLLETLGHQRPSGRSTS